MLAHPHLHTLLHLVPLLLPASVIAWIGWNLWKIREGIKRRWRQARAAVAVQVQHQQLKQCPYCGATRGITSMLPPWDDTSVCSECKQEWAW